MQITFTTSDYNTFHVSCFGSKDGSITVHVTGGTPPYKYLWSNGDTTATITGLSPDFYNVVVTDSNTIQAENGINLTAPKMLKPLLSAYEYNNGFNISLYGASNGSITTTVVGGVFPFTFQWEDGPTVQNRSMLGGGFYSLVVTDANNCIANEQTTLSEPERDDWTLTGNTGSNPGNQYLGTNDNKDFVFKTNALERIRLKSNGIIDVLGNLKFDSLAGDTMSKSLFIGTDGSLYRSGQGGDIRSTCNMVADWYVGVDVAKDVVLCDPEQQVGIEGCIEPLEAFQIGDRWTFHSSHGTGDNKSIGFNSRWTGTASVKFVTGYSSSLTFNDNGSIGFRTDNSTTAGTIGWIDAMHIDKTGRVTLGGYQAASEQLEIVHDKADGGMALNRVNSSNQGKSEIKFMHNGVAKWALGNDLNNDGTENFYLWNTGNNVSVLYADQYGRFGINVIPPTNNTLYKLYVEGGIVTRDILVKASGWPDYVLEKNYPLMSIADLAEFINENRHLPGLPSANEIKENEGYEIGDMQQKLLQKIEEQTLYIIELQRQMNELKAEVKRIKK